MDTSAIAVIVGGIVLIAFILWYFFGEKETVAARTGTSGVQEVDIKVEGGYSPDVIEVEQSRPVRLNFYRNETSACSEEVIFGDFGIARTLPAFQTTPVEFTPDRAGTFTFTCGMNMLRGKLIVRPAAR